MATALTGRVVAITGAARGIGLATAKTFLAAGAKVAIGDVDAELAAKAAVELGSSGTVVGLPLNVTDEVSFAEFLDKAESELGRLDVLVNNAGIMPTGLFADEAVDMTNRIVDINLRGVITGSRLAAQRFIPRRGGHLLNVASLAGVSGFPGLATYCGTKHAVIGFSEALHRELAEHGVGVTAVLPGIVRTELSAGSAVPRLVAALSTVDPKNVAQAMVAAVGTRRPLVTMPRRMGVTLKAMSLLPYRARRVAERLTGADTAYTKPNLAAREAYHQRLRGQS